MLDGKRALRLVMAVAAAVGIVIALFIVLVILNAGFGFSGTTASSPLGWALPIVAGLLIGGVAWMLLFTAPNYSDDDEDEMRHSVPCPGCDQPVMADWRMCPYCGRILGFERPVEQHS